MKDDDVYYVSEHRGSFNNKKNSKMTLREKRFLIILQYQLQDLKQH
jgi:hypothetical protein